jgi:hypothetical protein
MADAGDDRDQLGNLYRRALGDRAPGHPDAAGQLVEALAPAVRAQL